MDNRAREFTENFESSDSATSNTDCTMESHDVNQDRAWKALNQSLIPVWSNIDSAADDLSYVFTSITKVPMHFVRFTVPRNFCCFNHLQQKEEECLAFLSWMLGHLVDVLAHEQLSAMHPLVVDWQRQIVSCLLATHPRLFMRIATCYLRTLQALLEVHKGTDVSFPVVLRHFSAGPQTVRDLQLDLSPCHMQVTETATCGRLLVLLTEVLDGWAAGLQWLPIAQQRSLWAVVCLLLEENAGQGLVAPAAAARLAAALLQAPVLPELEGWCRLWEAVGQRLLAPAPSTDPTSDPAPVLTPAPAPALGQALAKVLQATLQRLHSLGALHTSALWCALLGVMRGQLCSSLHDEVEGPLCELTHSLMNPSSHRCLDRQSAQRMLESFVAGNQHPVPGLRNLVIQELGEGSSSTDGTSVGSLLDSSPSWRELWKQLMVATGRLQQASADPRTTLQELRLCRSIVELGAGLGAADQKLALMGGWLPTLVDAAATAVLQCKPAACGRELAAKVLEQALALAAAAASLPEVAALEGLPVAEALLALPWLPEEPRDWLGLPEGHALFSVRKDCCSVLDSALRQRCIAWVSHVGGSGARQSTWRRALVRRWAVEAEADVLAEAVRALPWLLHWEQAADVLEPFAQVLIASDVPLQLAVAGSLGSMACTLAGNCSVVREGVSQGAEQRLSCSECEACAWQPSASPEEAERARLLLGALPPLLRSESAEVRRAVVCSLPALAGHLPSLCASLQLELWTPLLLDPDREVRVLLARRARWLVLAAPWVHEKQVELQAAGSDLVPLSQQDRHQLASAEPLLARFFDALLSAERETLQRCGDPCQESLVLTVTDIGCLPVERVLLPALTHLILLAGHVRGAHAGLARAGVHAIARAHNVTPVDLFRRFKPELCETISRLSVAAHLASGGCGFVGTLTTLARLLGLQGAQHLVMQAGAALVAPLVMDAVARAPVRAVLPLLAGVAQTPLSHMLKGYFQNIYPYIAVRKSDKFLQESLEFLQAECEPENVEVILKNSLKVIHNELLLHVEGKQQRVLEVLQQLAQVDPLFQRQSPAQRLSSTDIADFLQPRFLGVLWHLDECLVSEGVAQSVQGAALRAMPVLIRLMGPRHISMVRFNVLATLRLALRLSHANFPHLAIAAWDAFVHSLEDTYLGPLLSTIFASLMPLLDLYPEEVANVFSYVVVDKKEDLWPYFKELYFVPEHPKILEVVSLVLSHSPTPKTSSFYSQVKEKLMYVAHENVDVRLHALQFLTRLLGESRRQVNGAMVKQERIEPCIVEMLRRLTEACRDLDKRVRVAAAECLGVLGAVDPGAVPPSEGPVGATCFLEVDSQAFAEHALVQLTKGFQEAADTRDVDAFSYSIQELLKVYHIDCNSPLWASFTTTMQDIMRPLLNTSYKSNFRVSRHFPPVIYGSKMGLTLREWVVNWSVKLISEMPEGRALSVFMSCVLAFKRSVPTVLFFLPYIVLHTLADARVPEEAQGKLLAELRFLTEPPAAGDRAHGWVEEQAALKEPMALAAKAMVRRQSSLRARSQSGDGLTPPAASEGQPADWQRCSRVALQLVDFLWRWVRQTRMSSAKDDSTGQSTPLKVVQDFLSKMCKQRLSLASLECEEYARALVYLEQYLKEHPAELQANLGLLEDLHVHLDDPDAVAGVLAIQGCEPSLKQMARAHEATGQFESAAACYAHMAQEQRLAPEQVVGLMRCYLSLDQPFAALQLAEAIMVDRPELAEDVHEQFAESLWRLHRFPQLEEAAAAPPLSVSRRWGVQVGRALLLLRRADHQQLAAVLDDTKRAVLEQLACAARPHAEYFHIYEHIIKLHILYEMKQASEALSSALELGGADEEAARRILLTDLLEDWGARLRVMRRSAGTLEPVLRLRRIMLEQACSLLQGQDDKCAELLSAEIGNYWLQSAKAARKEGYHQQAYIYLLKAHKFAPPALFLEKARLFWSKGDQESAFNTLKRGLEEQFKDTPEGQQEQRLCAKARLLLAEYNEQTAQVDAEQLVQQYSAAVKACEKWERPLVLLARFYSHLFQNMPEEDKDTRGAEMQVAMVSYLGRSLQYGTKYLYQSLPRMLTLWLDFGNTASTGRGEPPAAVQATGRRITDLIEAYASSLPPYLFYTAFSQLVSRICHPNPVVMEQLRALLLNVLVAYPQQALWLLMGSIKSCYVLRARRCQELLQHSRVRQAKLTQLVSDYTRLTDCLIELTNGNVNVGSCSLSRLAPGLVSLLASPGLGEVLMPVERFLSFVLPAEGVPSSHVAFPQRLVYVRSAMEDVLVLQSLQKPRRLALVGSDGQSYYIMCKPKDDLRKDFRLMEFNSVVNRLLRRDAASSQRALHIRTYAVVPLNEECGLVEWLLGLVGLRPLLLKLYRQIGVSVGNRTLKEMLATRKEPMPKRREAFQRLLAMHPPQLSEWFLATFPDAATWHVARTSYVRTAAVMSMVGYVLGLGDRHGENILLDQQTGEAVHVDFNCLFNKGENFDWPEVVPFRLTQNMVAAMGPLGVEGPFRRSCEATLRVLRAQADTLMSVLRPFLYDPIISWKSSRTGRRSHEVELTNELALQHLNRIERRLQGAVRGQSKVYASPLSVEGQANSLIAEATHLDNLCRMYVGWGAYL